MFERLIAKIHELVMKKTRPGGYSVTVSDLLDLLDAALDVPLKGKP